MQHSSAVTTRSHLGNNAYKVAIILVYPVSCDLIKVFHLRTLILLVASKVIKISFLQGSDKSNITDGLDGLNRESSRYDL